MKKILSVFLGLATILSLGFTSAFADPSAAEPDIGTDADEEVTAQKIVSASSVSREENSISKWNRRYSRSHYRGAADSRRNGTKLIFYANSSNSTEAE